MPSGEIRALTGLRFVAALWVVLIHFQTVLAQAFGARVGLFAPVVLSGWLGVDLFFVLSGYVMVLTYVAKMGPRWDTRRALTFVWLRLARIWPLWAVLTVASFSWHRLTGFAASQGGSIGVRAMLEQLLLVQMWHRSSNLGSSLILPGWSLSVEFLAYLAFPVAVMLFWRIRRAAPVLLCSLAVGAMLPLALIALKTGHVDYLLPWPVRIAGGFVSGGVTCLAVERLKHIARVRSTATAVSVLAIVQILAVCYWAQNRVDLGSSDQRGIAVVFLPVLVGSLSLSSAGPARFLSREPLVVGGRISFALYLVHFCFMDAGAYLQARFAGLAAGSARWTLLQAELIFVALLAAYLLWRFVEEPSRNALRGIGPGRRARTMVGASGPAKQPDIERTARITLPLPGSSGSEPPTGPLGARPSRVLGGVPPTQRPVGLATAAGASSGRRAPRPPEAHAERDSARESQWRPLV